MKLTAVYMKVPEGYIAFVEELPGSNTQGATIEEAGPSVPVEVLGFTVYINSAARKSSAVPRHREVNDFLARKICADLKSPIRGRDELLLHPVLEACILAPDAKRLLRGAVGEAEEDGFG